MAGWWEAINKFRGKTKGKIGEYITGKQWNEYFDKLLNDGEESEDEMAEMVQGRTEVESMTREF